MSTLSNTISGFIPSQVPGYIVDNYPNFVAVLQSYFKFLEDTTFNGTVYQIRNLLGYKEIDSTTPEFYKYFQQQFLPYFPQTLEYDLVKLLKIATQFYQTKGSQNSIEFLFRVIYGLDSEIFYPKNNILRLSAGIWNLPQAFKLTLRGSLLTFDVNQLVGRQGVGSQSNSTCTIESVDVAIDPTLNQEIVEIFVSNVSDAFLPGESLVVNCGNAANGQPIIFSEGIIGSLSEVIVDQKNEGLAYVGTKLFSNGAISYPGNPVSIIGGLGGSNIDIMAVAYVGNVTSGSVTGVEVDSGGYGYSLFPNTLISIIDAPGDAGVGANVIVNGIDSANQVELILNTDSIQFKMNVVIGSNNYNFSNTTNANLNTTFANAFSYVALNVAPVTSIEVVSGGSGYTEVPTLNLRSMFDSDFSTGLFAAYQAAPTPTNFNNWVLARPNVADLGIIAHVSILNGGAGYSNTTDRIVVDSEIGIGATFTFTTGGLGQITKVIVTNGGVDYYDLNDPEMPPLLVVNSANIQNVSAGTGAVLQPIGFNQGDSYTLSVSSIGQVEDIRLVNRGFDYISTPLVSLRNQDITIAPLANNQLFFQTDPVFQGANLNTATFTAFVDVFDRANSSLRLYNYIGVINLSQNLIGANFNSTPLSANVYGNGKARANAEFLGGLIDFPGFWLTTAGFLSADQSFQDSVEFQNYSYLIKVEKALASYGETLKNIAHPAGMKMLGLCTVTSMNPEQVTTDAEKIQIANTTNMTGNVTINAFGNGFITGLNTAFVGNVNVGDLFIIGNVATRQATKVVKSVINNNALLLESNTMFFSQNTINLVATSNTVHTQFANVTGNFIPNDIITTNVNGNGQTSIVQQITGGPNFNVNTVFLTTANNVRYAVYPSYVNVPYGVLDPS